MTRMVWKWKQKKTLLFFSSFSTPSRFALSTFLFSAWYNINILFRHLCDRLKGWKIYFLSKSWYKSLHFLRLIFLRASVLVTLGHLYFDYFLFCIEFVWMFGIFSTKIENKCQKKIKLTLCKETKTSVRLRLSWWFQFALLDAVCPEQNLRIGEI